jgi:hypothetical protein
VRYSCCWKEAKRRPAPAALIALKEGLVTLAPRPLYASDPECIIILFDLREPQASEQVHHLRAVWQADSDLEALGPDHMIVFLFPGAAAWRLAA